MPVKNPDLIPLFEQVKALLEPFADEFPPRKDEPGCYELWSDKQVEFFGKVRKEGVFFAGALIQKHYVGLYYMPVYAIDEARQFIGPELLRTLKGKSCFYIKSLTPELTEQIQTALAEGARLYRERGWV
jgi:hypothetical protein